MTASNHDYIAEAADEDLLVRRPSDRLMSLSYIASELRRHRRAIVAIALVGMFGGVLLGAGVPQSKSATATLYLESPPNSDTSTTMDTQIALLETRPVQDAAEARLGLPRFTMPYRGTALSPKVMTITAKGPDAATAERRANALADAFLAIRAQVLQQQLKTLAATTHADQVRLQAAIAALGSDASPDAIAQRADLHAQVQADDARLNTATFETDATIANSDIVDRAYTPHASKAKTAVKNAASGLVAGLAIAFGLFTFLAVTSTRVRRRADVAAALQAPVTLSVGTVVPTGGRRLIPWRLDRTRAAQDLNLIVRHLRRALLAAPTPDLVVLSIDNVDVVTPCVTALQRELESEGHRVRVVNETGRPLPRPEPSETEASSFADVGSPDIVIVLAVLDPAKGAEHLREWASKVVAFVSAGRSSATKLESHGTMVRSAGLSLSSVVLVNSDPTDDSLGIYEEQPAALRAVGLRSEDSPSAFRSG